MPQLEHIDAIEKRLRGAADTLRANSSYASNEYFLPVMGLVFLRHAYSRYLAVKDDIEPGLHVRRGKKRAMTKEDFSRRSAIFLRPEARFDHLVALPDGEDNDRLYKHAVRLMETCEKECDAKSGDAWNGRDITRARKAADEARRNLTKQDESAPVHAWGQLRKVRYFWRQARWITERFPGAELRDVVGLVKLVDRAEIEANDWSLTPGRYVGVAPEEEDEDFDFGEAMRALHAELDDLNAEVATLAATIRKNFEGLGT